jgi:hypothetical protein
MANWSDQAIDVKLAMARPEPQLSGPAVMLLARCGLMNPLWMAAAGLMLLEKTVTIKSLVYGAGWPDNPRRHAIAFYVVDFNAVS